MGETGAMILLIAGIVGIAVLATVLKRLANTAVDKGFDAIHNARVRKEEQTNPPKAENLADRYKTPTDSQSKEENCNGGSE